MDAAEVNDALFLDPAAFGADLLQADTDASITAEIAALRGVVAMQLAGLAPASELSAAKPVPAEPSSPIEQRAVVMPGALEVWQTAVKAPSPATDIPVAPPVTPETGVALAQPAAPPPTSDAGPFSPPVADAPRAPAFMPPPPARFVQEGVPGEAPTGALAPSAVVAPAGPRPTQMPAMNSGPWWPQEPPTHVAPIQVRPSDPRAIASFGSPLAPMPLLDRAEQQRPQWTADNDDPAPAASSLSLRGGEFAPAPASSPSNVDRAPPAGPTHGDVYLDGVRVGRWMAETLARGLGGPARGTSAFDPLLGPRWPGALQGH